MKYFILAFKKYAVFKGRSTRKEYWYFVLFHLLISTILLIIDIYWVGFESKFHPISSIFGWLTALPYISVTVRRFHDTNHSGFWYFIGLIPIIGWIIQLKILIDPSDVGKNQYNFEDEEIFLPEDAPLVIKGKLPEKYNDVKERLKRKT